MLYQKARKLIPGGTQLLSKRPEMFLPEQWPAYYSKAKGCEVWDLDVRKYIDMSIMGVGSCILGYADADVNKAVKKAVDNGTMSTLNAPEEVELAELLCKIHPWADMARYARTGGEAMAIAERIALARALAGKPSLLILDEATSALDHESEKLIHESIRALHGAVTVLIIAHRPSTIAGADTIFVLNQGRIVERGTPQELLGNNNSYFYKMQKA